ncbi:MAG: hypothetical protein A3F09_00035 [Chlamydiae bacterium RIFCSPHIGHO2_12_FULL_49_11]|nr:MAG: hypothetical protein A3F09_00035 [Chlamydiae bacterium RIFCSPHIGHO2_12_FULL_49_11]
MPFVKEKWVPFETLSDWAKEIHKSGKTIVSVNGCFDILHPGHLHLLFEAASLGDVLIVALNADVSIRTYKNALRPIHTMEERVNLIGSLAPVDYVTSFDDATPIGFIRTIRPDVHVVGDEYKDRAVEKEAVEEGGGHMHFVRKVPPFSSSRTIERILERYEKVRSCE